MLLAIDCGNTNTVFSIWDGEKFLSTWRIATDHKRTADEYFVWLHTLMTLHRMDVRITEAIISSTVPRVVFNLRVLCNRYFDCRPLVVGKPETRLPVAPRVDQGTTVGPDRLVNTVAAHDRHGGDLIVVDFGTATTFDVISAAGEYLGGAIIPGIEISLDALFGRAAALRRVELTEPRSVIGKTTMESIQSGVLYGWASMIDGMSDRIEEVVGDATVIATGGLADLVAPLSDAIEHVEPWLTLHGLRLIWEKNR